MIPVRPGWYLAHKLSQISSRSTSSIYLFQALLNGFSSRDAPLEYMFTNLRIAAPISAPTFALSLIVISTSSVPGDARRQLVGLFGALRCSRLQYALGLRSSGWRSSPDASEVLFAVCGSLFWRCARFGEGWLGLVDCSGGCVKVGGILWSRGRRHAFERQILNKSMGQTDVAVDRSVADGRVY